MSSRTYLPLTVFFMHTSFVFAGDAHQVEVAKQGGAVPKIAEASDEGQNAIKQFTLAEGLSASLWAAEPLLANPVAFATDRQGRWFVAETFRLHAGVSDIRAHMDWLEAELASTSLETWMAILKGDPKVDFAKNALNSERVQQLWDSTGAGKADKSTIFAEGLNEAQSGIAASILSHKGKVYLTNIPELLQFQDTKGTGMADVRKTLSRGFGIRTAFLGHDLHGLRIGPDGRLYFSIGDRATNATAHDGSKVYNPETGAVYRCNLDGSQLEIFALGLRNPQDLIFDEYGNLFTGDNNSDGGDPARVVYVIQGGDSGWRIGWQFLNSPSRGPWLSERMCYPAFEGQAAHHVPPLAILGNGPSGITYYPGTGLSSAWKNHFFLADFRGSASNSGIHSFTVQPKGANFELMNPTKPVWGVLATDVEFGVDGGLYVADWVNGWGMPGKGRIYKVLDAGTTKDALVAETKTLLAEGMEKRSVDELLKLLAHADMRVRQDAQFELVDRGSSKELLGVARDSKIQLARIHAIWGVGQLARQKPEQASGLLEFLKDSDAEVRAQAAKTLGDLKTAAASEGLTTLLKDSSSRVRGFAAIGLGRIGYPTAVSALWDVLRENQDQDSVLRYAAVSGLVGCATPETLIAASKDPSRSARIGAVNALRRLKHAGVSEFLKDSDPLVLAEAARAIYDESIEAALPELAKLSEHVSSLFALPVGTKELPGQLDAVLRRVVNANFRVGQSVQAKALAQIASLSDAPEGIRVEALTRVSEWEHPSNVDKLMGLYRPLQARDAAVVIEAAGPVLSQLITEGPKAVRLAALRLVEQLGFQKTALDLLGVIKDTKTDAGVRVGALKALAARGDGSLAEAVSLCAADGSEALRKEATGLLVKLNLPGGVVPALAAVFEKGTMGEKQTVLITLGDLKDPAADEALVRHLDAMLGGHFAPQLQLELLEAAAKRSSEQVKSRVQKYEASLDPKDVLAPYRIALQGGDAAAGKKVFMEKPEASCVRCHKVKNDGAEVGPILTGVGARQTREYLLESIVDPNAKIAEGFEPLMITLKDGSIHAGIFKKETETELSILPPTGALETLKKSEITQRTKGLSGMPPLGAVLSKRDLRDLVEFLAQQK
ncbi:MAG: HEAT repeat domain-containing protein [Verrucomicrobiota bacterium]